MAALTVIEDVASVVIVFACSAIIAHSVVSVIESVVVAWKRWHA